MTQKVVRQWLNVAISCFMFLSCSIGAKAEQQKSTNFNVAPPLTKSLDLTTQSSTLVDPADVRLCGTGCTGTAGAVSIITSNALPTLSFQLTNGGKNTGEAYLTVLVPTGDSMPSFTVNGNGATTLTSSSYSSGALTDFLAANVGNLSLASGSGVNANFSAYASATAQVTASPSSFEVYVYDLGAFNGAPLSIAFNNISGFPTGTIFWGFLTNQSCTTGPCVLTDTTPLSEAVAVTVTPEPGTIVLVGSGLLLLLAGTVRRRLAEG
ncbi:MAG TPA: PEP-CTERM sorting domain-containing protein [Candidatus Dormibacteraeota bacterium]|nr:PEP-CTERM sorting domain-containing protein [Candidatus Dormibacteraeota bacterium]